LERAVRRPIKRKPQGRPRKPPAMVLPGVMLVLDLGSLRCGWALARVDAQGKATERSSGVLYLEAVSNIRWKRVLDFSRWVGRTCSEQGVTFLAVEEPHTKNDNVGTRHLLHGLYAFADVISGLRFKQPVTPINRTDVFKATVGWCRRALDDGEMRAWRLKPKNRLSRAKTVMRSPTKTEIKAAVNARHGSKIESEDEADAVAALDMLLAELAGTGPAPVQIEVAHLPMPRVPGVAALPLFAAGGRIQARLKRRVPT
jgi:Holliday junction resolvasome RuvABC endonuclease subunit